MKQTFKIEITSPCGRGGYDGGETVLHHGENRLFGTGPFMACFPEVGSLEDGDEVEVTITLSKKRRAR